MLTSPNLNPKFLRLIEILLITAAETKGIASEPRSSTRDHWIQESIKREVFYLGNKSVIHIGPESWIFGTISQLLEKVLISVDSNFI